MVVWIHIALVAASAGIFLLLFFFFHNFCCHTKQPQTVERAPSLQNGISKLHHQENVFNNKRRTNYYLSRRGVSSKPLFNWSDNPSLITDAVENGWSRFAFTDFASSLSVRSNRFLLGSCAAAGDGSGGDVEEVEISWEVCQGSADFMQKIRLNSGLKKIATATSSSMAAASVIKSALPLPGPALGNSTPFPQEAYFEITILSDYENENGSDINGKANTGEGENIKLIQEDGVNGRGVHVNFEESRGRSVTKDIVEGKNEAIIMLSVGLAVGGSPPVKLPGSYPGSVGFNSDGSIYLDGMLYFIDFLTNLESNSTPYSMLILTSTSSPTDSGNGKIEDLEDFFLENRFQQIPQQSQKCHFLTLGFTKCHFDSSVHIVR